MWQAVFVAEEINGACLAIVLRKDAAIAPLIGIETVPRDGSFGDDLFPSKLVGVPLRGSTARVCECSMTGSLNGRLFM